MVSLLYVIADEKVRVESKDAEPDFRQNMHSIQSDALRSSATSFIESSSRKAASPGGDS